VVGGLAQYAGAPLRLPYLVLEVLMAAGAVALAFTPETVQPPEHRRRYRPQRIAVPAASRVTFFAASIATAVGFALFGLFSSLAPGFIADTLHDHSHALAGAASFWSSAPPRSRRSPPAGPLAGLFLAAYLGLVVPVVGLGFAGDAFSVGTSLLGFSTALAVVIGLVSRRLLARRGRG
jgi:hypothetical protein